MMLDEQAKRRLLNIMIGGGAHLEPSQQPYAGSEAMWRSIAEARKIARELVAKSVDKK